MGSGRGRCVGVAAVGGAGHRWAQQNSENRARTLRLNTRAKGGCCGEADSGLSGCSMGGVGGWRQAKSGRNWIAVAASPSRCDAGSSVRPGVTQPESRGKARAPGRRASANCRRRRWALRRPAGFVLRALLMSVGGWPMANMTFQILGGKLEPVPAPRRVTGERRPPLESPHAPGVRKLGPVRARDVPWGGPALGELGGGKWMALPGRVLTSGSTPIA